MKRIPFKVILFSLIGLVAVGSLVSQAPTPTSNNATNVASQACTSSGVTLVIDFGSLNKQAQSFCVSNFSGNSWKLFEAAGLKVQVLLSIHSHSYAEFRVFLASKPRTAWAHRTLEPALGFTLLLLPIQIPILKTPAG